MCVMDVRNGQRTSTEIQAMAHNTNTVRGDMDFIMAQLDARGITDESVRHDLKLAGEALNLAYRHFLAAWSSESAREIRAGHHIPDSETVGSERVHVSPADRAIERDMFNVVGHGVYDARTDEYFVADAHRAEKFETRQGGPVYMPVPESPLNSIDGE